MADEINVISRTQTIVVEPTSGAVSVMYAGPQGPQGLEGGLTEALFYEYVDLSGSSLLTQGAATIVTEGDMYIRFLEAGVTETEALMYEVSVYALVVVDSITSPESEIVILNLIEMIDSAPSCPFTSSVIVINGPVFLFGSYLAATYGVRILDFDMIRNLDGTAYTTELEPLDKIRVQFTALIRE